MRYALTILLMLPLLIVPQWPANSSEFRTFRPIAVPQARHVPNQAHATEPATAAVAFRPVSRRLAGEAVKRVLSAWNGNDMNTVLAQEFFDKSQLNDAMNSKVPRDARLSLLAIQGIRTIDQKTTDSPSGKLLVSTVSITASTQLTFNDPANGYQRREGVNEYIVRIKQKQK